MRGMIVSLIVVAGIGTCGRAEGQDWEKLTKAAKAPLTEAIAKALADAKEGVATGAEIEDEGGKIRYSVDVAQGTKKTEYVFDAADWKLLEKTVEDEDQSSLVKAAKYPLSSFIETSLNMKTGRAVFAELTWPSGRDRPLAIVKVFHEGGLFTATYDATTGGGGMSMMPETAPQKAEQDEKPYTSSFGEDEKDFATTGSNPFFILEPGWFVELEKTEGGKKVTILQTVLEDTKKIAGVECRAVEDKEMVDGVVKEITRDYYAISKKTNNVYYFGEDVDVYKDGKVASHDGAWLAGEKGNKYGLFMAATPLLGARYYQEIAPGVAMDRGEVMSLSEKFECPAGKFENVLKVLETSEIEKGEHEMNFYARGIGCIGDDEAKLVKYGKGKK